MNIASRAPVSTTVDAAAVTGFGSAQAVRGRQAAAAAAPGNIAATGSSTGSTQTNGTAHSVSKPGTAATGDTAEVAIVVGPGSGGGSIDTTVTGTPSGWTLVSGPTNVGSATDGKLYRYRRRLDGTSADDFACTTVDACKSASLMRTYSGVDAVTPGDVAAQTGQGSAQSSGQVPAITTVTEKAWAVGAWANLTGSGTITAPAGMTEGTTFVFTGGYRLSLFEQGPLTPAGSFGPTTATFNATRQWAGSIDALRPALI